jgi:hypothetical protein
MLRWDKDAGCVHRPVPSKRAAGSKPGYVVRCDDVSGTLRVVLPSFAKEIQFKKLDLEMDSKMLRSCRDVTHTFANLIIVSLECTHVWQLAITFSYLYLKLFRTKSSIVRIH